MDDESDEESGGSEDEDVKMMTKVIAVMNR